MNALGDEADGGTEPGSRHGLGLVADMHRAPGGWFLDYLPAAKVLVRKGWDEVAIRNGQTPPLLDQDD